MSLVRLSSAHDGLRIVTLNDPDRRNAMGLEMAEAFRETIASLESDKTGRAVIITGAGSAFSAGGDLQMLQEKSRRSFEQNRREMLSFYESFLGMLSLPLPLVAAINGHAIGAGACVAMACDYRVVAAKAKIGFNFVRLGLHPGMGATCTLARVAGTAIATDLLISGRIISGEEMAELRLANCVVEQADEVVSSAAAFAREISHSGPMAVAGLLNKLRPAKEELRASLAWEAEQQAKNYASPDFQEGIRAALEKRPPRF